MIVIKVKVNYTDTTSKIFDMNNEKLKVMENNANVK